MVDFQLDVRSWGTTEIAVAAAVVVVTGLLVSWLSRGRLRLPPGPRGYPIIGILPYLGAHPHESFYNLAKRYGPVMFMKMGYMPLLVLSSPEAAKEVLQTQDLVFASRPKFVVPSVLLYNQQDLIFSPMGAHWRRLRKICSLELLAAHRVRNCSKLIASEVWETIHIILRDTGSSKPVTITKVLKGMTANVITQMLWSRRHLNLVGKKDRFEHVFGLTTLVSGTNNLLDFLPDFFPGVFTTLLLKFLKFESGGGHAHRELDFFMETLLREREEELSQGIRAKPDEEDFMQALLNIADKTDTSPGLSRETIKATFLDMLVAGQDSSSTTIDWCLAELMIQPNLLKKAQDELTAVVGKDRMVRESDLPNLKYIDALVKETLRRRNPSPTTIPHFSTGDCKVAGYDVPANTMMLVNFYALHHDPAVWKDPYMFNPDRFLETNIDMGGRNFNYLPFGTGRRMCLGMNLASSVLHLALAQLLHCFDWSLPEGVTKENVDMSEFSGVFLYRKNPLDLVPKPRLSPHAYDKVTESQS